jgi:hypothetical protein
MADSATQRSQRFTKAARAERERLARRRSQLMGKRDGLQSKIDALDQELESIEWEISGLETFVSNESGRDLISIVERPKDNGLIQLSGADIRLVAVPLLMREQRSAPIHYRAWLELLVREGYGVVGKRPDAVFLNQVARSPLVRATTKAGYYAIDLASLDLLREKLRAQQAELAERMANVPSEPAEFQAHREGNRALKITISRTERELDETLQVIEAASLKPAEMPQIRAA